MTGAFPFTEVMAWAAAMGLAFIVCDWVTGTGAAPHRVSSRLRFSAAKAAYLQQNSAPRWAAMPAISHSRGCRPAAMSRPQP